MREDSGEPLSYTERLWLAGYLIWALLAIVLATACGACGARQRPDDVPTMSQPSIVMITAIEDGKDVAACTAWKLSAKRVATAGHCCTPNRMYLPSGPSAVPGTLFTNVLLDDDVHDVCIIEGELLGDPIPLAHRDPQIGERVWTAGYPARKYMISDGYWSGRDSDLQGKTSTLTFGGASGSPLMDSHGRVVGIVSRVWPNTDSIGFTVPIEWVRIDAMKAK
jgi:hypothetical protein